MNGRKGKKLLIESNHRLSGSVYDCVFNMHSNLFEVFPDENIKLEFLSFSIKYDKYNINSEENSIFIFVEDGVDKVITIPNGNYSVTEIKTAIQSALNSASVNYSWIVTYSTTSNKYTYTPSLTGAETDISLDFTQYPNLTTHKILGFDREIVVMNISGKESTNIITIGNDHYVYIHSNLPSDIIRSDDKTTSLFAIVPFLAIQYGTLYFETIREDLYTISLSEIPDTIHFRLLNREDSAIKFNSEWTMLIQIVYTKKNPNEILMNLTKMMALSMMK